MTKSDSRQLWLEFVGDLKVGAKLGTQVRQQCPCGSIEPVALGSVPWAGIRRVVLIQGRVVPIAELPDTCRSFIGQGKVGQFNRVTEGFARRVIARPQR